MLSKAQEAYLVGAPPSYPAIEAIVAQGHSEELFPWPNGGKSTWREQARADLEIRYQFTGKWLDGPAVHNLLERLPLKPAFRVYLEESVLWLQAWTPPQEFSEGFQPGTRILVLPKNAETEAALHGIGHVGYQAWLYQVPELQQAFMAALEWYAAQGEVAQRRPGGAFPTDEHEMVWWRIWGYINAWWQADRSWFDGFLEPWNPDEAFASLFSACRGRMELLPPGLRVFYRGLVGG